MGSISRMMMATSVAVLGGGHAEHGAKWCARIDSIKLGKKQLAAAGVIPAAWFAANRSRGDGGLREEGRWGKLKELPIPLHVGVEDLLKMLNLPDINTLHYEVCYLSRYVDDEYLFKVGLSIQAGRSHACMLKKSTKVSEVVVQPSKVALK
ncbi:hypothetical protein M5K25_019385 [Dendrobium thyrsiflorum]|uniref:Uncharacterized protein n=1 Tax=Dendrobium thyrsiflorum TaxID=117978 RepID=A0ABD0UEX8_DENTH